MLSFSLIHFSNSKKRRPHFSHSLAQHYKRRNSTVAKSMSALTHIETSQKELQQYFLPMSGSPRAVTRPEDLYVHPCRLGLTHLDL